MSMTVTEMMAALMTQFDASTAQVLDVKTTAFELHLNKQATTTATESITAVPTTVPLQESLTEAATNDTQRVVTAPLVGVAYLAADPKQEPYVQVGDHVTAGDTLCVIEAMKMINEVPSPVSGTVKTISVANGSMVEFDEPLVTIEVAAE